MGLCKPRSVKFYKDEHISEPVRLWLDKLKKQKKSIEVAKINTRIDRASQGNFGDYRFLSGNLGELKIDVGPGYRVYFGLDGDELIILLAGGTKETQQTDIELAKTRWKNWLETNDKEVKNGQ